MIIANVSLAVSGEVFPALVMSVLAPAISTMDTLPALLLVVFLTQFLWFFGLHGPSITSAVWASFAVSYGAENIANYAAGQPVEHAGNRFRSDTRTGSDDDAFQITIHESDW